MGTGNPIVIGGDDDRPSLTIDAAGRLYVWRPWEAAQEVVVTTDDLAGRTAPKGLYVRYRLEAAIAGATVIGMRHEETGEALRLIALAGQWWWDAVGHVCAPADVDRARRVRHNLANFGGELREW